MVPHDSKSDLPLVFFKKISSHLKKHYFFQARFPDEILVTEATMNFINLPSRGRRLVKVPSMKVSGPTFYVGFEEKLAATVAAIPFKKDEFCLVLILPGRPSDYIAGGLSQIESKLNNETWSGLMRSLQPIEGIDIQFPVINHRYVIIFFFVARKCLTIFIPA